MYFCSKNPEALQRIVHLLSFVMIRRTYKDRIFDRPLIDLPAAHSEVKQLDFFSAEERCLYQVLEEKYRVEINTYYKDKVIGKYYGNVLISVLRLRQATSHPLLLQKLIQERFTLEDVRRLEARLNRIVEGRPFLRRLRDWLVESKKQSSNPPASGSTEPAQEPIPDDSLFGRSSFGSNFGLKRYLENLDEEQLLQRSVCRICMDLAENPQITNCKHVFCKGCIERACIEAASSGSDYTECPTCLYAFTDLVPYEALVARPKPIIRQPDVAEDDGAGRKKRKRPSNPWLDMDGPIFSSTKTAAVKFTGDTDPKQRERVRTRFLNDPSVKIMIAGLKCGGQALNLTVANRVICVDVWWNYSVEEQAFGRVFRLTVDELASLFGFLKDDGHGNKEVVSDAED
ncbi:MAG: hypothetical protein M1826_000339 [Phylliscum demangeonii]|nr:MAG: hypothetical protein M1826_000339 [Phylliscum demangeonii]